MATQTEKLRIEVDNKQAQKNIEDQTKKIEELKVELEKLKKLYKVTPPAPLRQRKPRTAKPKAKKE